MRRSRRRGPTKWGMWPFRTRTGGPGAAAPGAVTALSGAGKPLLVLVTLAGAQAVDTAAQQPTSAAAPLSIEAVAPLAGCWEGGLGELDMREQWTEAEAGVMLGTTRYFREGELVDFEFAMITEADEGVVLWPYPRGERSEHGFPLVDAGRTLVFENLDHDFPVRIMYERPDDDRLAPRIEGRDGEGRSWELRRVRCPS